MAEIIHKTDGYPKFPEFASIDRPAVFPEYQFDMLYQQCDVLNRKIMKALYETLSDEQKEKITCEEDGLATLIPCELGINEDSVICVMFDANTFDVIDAFLPGQIIEDVFPLRRMDYAMDRLEKFVPEDIWLEGLDSDERTIVKEAIRKGAKNVSVAEAVMKYALLFSCIDVVKRVCMLPDYHYGSFDITKCAVCYPSRIVVELVYSVFMEDDIYTLPLGMWPISNYESKIMDFFNELAKKITPQTEEEKQKSVDVIVNFLKEKSSVIHDYDFTYYHILAREQFPTASDEDIYHAMCSLTDSEICLKNPPYYNKLIAPWRTR